MEAFTDIESLLPHRKPFLFVDSIDSYDDKGCVCHRTFTDEDFFFKGHFPEYPVVPGVILIETMAQGGGAALSLQKKFEDGSLFFLATVNNVKFKHQVRPGLTGWAQVNGFRGPTDELWKMEKRVELDVWYAENWNFMLDIKIMFLTVFNAIRGEQNAL